MSRSAALAFAWDMVSRYGEPVGGAGHDHVRVPLTQHELARRNGCSPGTVSWYLRHLGTAVVTRRNGVVFDRAALASLRASAPQLAPRTALVERELLESFAQPAADGTYVELLVDHPAGPKPPSLQDLATQLGINRSSAHRHVSALEHAGRLQRRGRRLYLVDPNHPPKESTVDDPSSPAPPGGTAISTEQVLQLLDKVADVMTTVADIALQLLAQSANPDDSHPRVFGAQTADGPGLRAAAAADRARGFSSEKDLIDRSDIEITSDQSPLRARESRESSRPRGGESRAEEGPDWTAADLPGLLAPLLEECERHGLPGVTDARRVIESLAPYDAEQVKTAARQMAADLRSGAPMRSPFAILVRKADDADPYYFRRQQEPEPPPPPPVLLDEGDAVDDEAQQAVEELDPPALAALDEHVAAHVQRLVGDAMAANALKSPATLAHWRPRVWRALQQKEQ